MINSTSQYFRLIFIASIFTAIHILVGCKNESPVKPPDVLPPPCDTCDTYLPLENVDSLYFNIPWPKYIICDVYASSRGFLAGSTLLQGWQNRGIEYYGFIYNPMTTTVIGFYGSDMFGWSHDGRYLLVGAGFNGVGVLDIETMKTYRPVWDDYSEYSWSLDDEWIYMHRYGGTFRVRPRETNVELISYNFRGGRQIDSTHLITFSDSGLVTYNMKTAEFHSLSWSYLPPPSNLIILHQWSLSPDRTKILADVPGSGGLNNPTRDGAGLYLFDLKAESVRKVLPGQYWFQEYHAQWTSNSTFFASYHCRKDSTSMVFEYNLNGRVLRQVTFKEMKLYL